MALQGELGAGKTTFSQGFARALGVKEKITSPTFVLMKIYELPCHLSPVTCHFRHFVHIDCYRLNSPKELADLGFKKILKDKTAIVLIEWAERVRRLLPKNAIWVKFEHGEKHNERIIKILSTKY